MSDPEKPLHVRVASALGWTHIVDILGPGILWRGIPPGVTAEEDEHGDLPFQPIPRYGWSEVGPLIDKYHINIVFGVAAVDTGFSQPLLSSRYVASWYAYGYGRQMIGDTPLLATCHLILALHQAGKLK